MGGVLSGHIRSWDIRKKERETMCGGIISKCRIAGEMVTFVKLL